jgi:hypothetical protein
MKKSLDTVNRSSLILVEKDGISLEQAETELATYRLQLECGEEIRYSLPLQAALLTAVNCGSRAFLGGVFLSMPTNVTCLLPWEKEHTLNEILIQLGAKPIDSISPDILTLTFGLRGDIRNNKAEVVASNWQGGLLVNGETPQYSNSGVLPLGGVYAGGLAIALTFMKISKTHVMALDKTIGCSLWRPDLKWFSEEAEGPTEMYIPSGLWILGLGHLGQAYLWTICLLAYPKPEEVNIMLQDYDKVVEANLSAGLLSTLSDERRYKSRVCADWLEKRGLFPRVTDRKFDALTKCGDDEPNVALCGFDNSLARTFLEEGQFLFVVEAGLGNSVNDFDKMAMHVFPSNFHTAREEWGNQPDHPTIKSKVLDAIKDDSEECGITAITIAGKAASASFVGACTAAFVLAEVIKGLNNGQRNDLIINQLRFSDDITLQNGKINYGTELGTSQFQYLK